MGGAGGGGGRIWLRTIAFMFPASQQKRKDEKRDIVNPVGDLGMRQTF